MAQTYNPSVKAVLYNRILLILGFAGLFVAGVLSLSHALNIAPPCGGSSGCEKVTNDRSSVIFGVPLAYIGLAAYLVLTAFAVLRSVGGSGRYKMSVTVGYLMAGFGTLTSIGLQAYSFMVIGQMCKWCLASAVIMTLTLIGYTFLFQAIVDRPVEEVIAARRQSMWDSLLPGALAFALVVGMGGMWYELRHQDKGVIITELPDTFPLVPKNPNIFGDPNSPITVVEFADLNCPSCQANSPLMKDLVRQHPGKIRLIYRHFPIPSHHTSEAAAFIDEYAAEKGKFWDYTMAVMSNGQNTKEETDVPTLYTIAQSLGLDTNDIKKRVLNDNDPIFARITADKNTANAIGVSMTPTFIIELKGQPTEAFTGAGALQALNGPPYSDVLNVK